MEHDKKLNESDPELINNIYNILIYYVYLGFLFDLLQTDEVIYVKVLENIIIEFELPIKIDVFYIIMVN